MPRYLYECPSCGVQDFVSAPLGQAPEMSVCRSCWRLMDRVFTMPQVCAMPERSREENRWWWVKDGETYSRQAKLEQDRADAKRYELDRKEWEENRKANENS